MCNAHVLLCEVCLECVVCLLRPGRRQGRVVDAMYGPKVYVLKNKDANMMGFYQRGRSYIVGFPKETHAIHVQKCTTMKSRMFVSNHHPDNVAHEVSYGLQKRGLGGVREASLDSITVDTTAHLNIEKKPLSMLMTPKCQIVTIDFDEFILMPFSKNIGVIMPMELLLEDKEKLIYESHVVDPCGVPSLFKMPGSS